MFTRISYQKPTHIFRRCFSRAMDNNLLVNVPQKFRQFIFNLLECKHLEYLACIMKFRLDHFRELEQWSCLLSQFHTYQLVSQESHSKCYHILFLSSSVSALYSLLFLDFLCFMELDVIKAETSGSHEYECRNRP